MYTYMYIHIYYIYIYSYMLCVYHAQQDLADESWRPSDPFLSMHLLRNITGLVVKYACVFISIYTHIKLLGSFSFIAPFERQNRIDCYICVCVYIYICWNTKSLGSFFFHVHLEKQHRNNCSMPANEPCYSNNPRDQSRCRNGFHFRFIESGNFSILHSLTW